MIQVYVTEMPNKGEECPFYMENNKKCNICHDKCCLEKGEGCKHLLTMVWDLAPEEVNGYE